VQIVCNGYFNSPKGAKEDYGDRPSFMQSLGELQANFIKFKLH